LGGQSPLTPILVPTESKDNEIRPVNSYRLHDGIGDTLVSVGRNLVGTGGENALELLA